MFSKLSMTSIKHHGWLSKHSQRVSFINLTFIKCTYPSYDRKPTQAQVPK